MAITALAVGALSSTAPTAGTLTRAETLSTLFSALASAGVVLTLR